MVDYIECYPEYLKFERTIKIFIGILNFSFLRLNFLNGYEKYILSILQIYSLISSVYTFLYYERNIMLIGLNSMMIVAAIQIIAKTSTIATKSNQLNDLFLFIQEVHEVREIDYLTNSSRIHLTKVLRITKLVLRNFMIPVWCISAAALSSYFTYANVLILAVPEFGLESHSTSSTFLKHHIHQVSLIIQVAISMAFVDGILITFGLYFIAITNIFCCMIRCIHNTELYGITKYLVDIHQFHCKILKKYQMLNNIFGYVFTIQTATSVVFILFIFFLLGSKESLVFIPLSVTILTQFGALCIFGEFLFSKTGEFATELYLTKWYEFSVKEQKMLLMMMYIAKRPLALKAAGMYEINLFLFIQVIKAGVSFCAILYTLA
uniref:Odorant receptor n=1 Tax=Phlebotomus papatasi TaxID=29031 RepID=A0A3F2ZEC5_PHLPP